MIGRPASRRLVLGAALAGLIGCKGQAQDESEPARGPPPPLKSLARFPVGCAVASGRLDEPAYASLVARHFSQLTAEWEMKMEYILRDDGGFRWDAPDRLFAFAQAHGQRLFGHTLIWYAQDPVAFRTVDGRGAAFSSAYRNYILAVVGRWAGRIPAWDVVNEAVAEDGEGLRPCLWSRNLGQQDYIRLAFEHAREADPKADLFLNDYNLESLPKKRATFLKLAEDLMKAGAPITGLGTQTHVAADLPPGEAAKAIAELGGLGLPIHVSELDVSLNRAGGLRSRAELARLQARTADEIAHAFMALPGPQRFAFTAWGARDRDSWLRDPKENPHPPWDAPLLFDDQGQAKAAFWAVADAFARNG